MGDGDQQLDEHDHRAAAELEAIDRARRGSESAAAASAGSMPPEWRKMHRDAVERYFDLLADLEDRVREGCEIDWDDLPADAGAWRSRLEEDLAAASAPARSERRLLPPVFQNPIEPRFRLIRQVGRGGMGQVFLAGRREPRQRVAIKVLLSATTEMLSRFQREAETIARVSHPGVARLLDTGNRAGDPALVMEFVEGTSLRRLVAIARRSVGQGVLAPSLEELASRAAEAVDTTDLTEDARPDERDGRDEPLAIAPRYRDDVVALIAGVCRTLASVLAEHGLVHRDLKPDNILVEPVDGRLRSRVVDFGLAKDAGAERSSTIGAVGTLDYLAPELLGANASQTDPRRDVYALGVTLYELLTLRRPFADPMNATNEADPPSAFAQPITKDLDEVVLKALRRHPADRYDTAGELGDDLERFLARMPVRARPLSTTMRFVRTVQRNRAAAIPIAIVVVAAVAAIVGLLTNLHFAKAHARGLTVDFAYRAIERVASAFHELRVAREARESAYREDEAASGSAYPPTERAIFRFSELDHRVRAQEATAIAVLADLESAASRIERPDDRRESLEILVDRYVELLRLHAGRDPTATGLILIRLDTLTNQLGRTSPLQRTVRVHADLDVARESDEPIEIVILEHREEQIGRVGGAAGMLVPVHSAMAPLDVDLPFGSYVAEVRVEPFVRLPFVVDVAAGETLDLGAIQLPDPDIRRRLVHEMAFVPAGGSILGGDTCAPMHGPRRHQRLASFWIKETPVTHGEYQEFIQAEKKADPRLTYRVGGIPSPELAAILPAIERDVYLDRERVPDSPVVQWHDDWERCPVAGISWAAADRYCDWIGGMVGATARLPEPAEWERAARGADGRPYCWGSASPSRPRIVPSLENVVRSVASTPFDVSVFGACDMNYLIREWTNRAIPDENGTLKFVYMGSYYFESVFPLAWCRLATEGNPGIGFRYVVDEGRRTGDARTESAPEDKR